MVKEEGESGEGGGRRETAVPYICVTTSEEALVILSLYEESNSEDSILCMIVQVLYSVTVTISQYTAETTINISVKRKNVNSHSWQNGNERDYLFVLQ